MTNTVAGSTWRLCGERDRDEAPQEAGDVAVEHFLEHRALALAPVHGEDRLDESEDSGERTRRSGRNASAQAVHLASKRGAERQLGAALHRDLQPHE